KPSRRWPDSPCTEMTPTAESGVQASVRIVSRSLRFLFVVAAVVALQLATGAPAQHALADGPDVGFDGGGWGHGLGMSQWGARGYAANGARFDAILTHYYSGTAITPVNTGNDAIRIGL